MGHLRKNAVFGALLACALFFASFLFLAQDIRYLNHNTYHYDEGIVSYGAVRILSGDLPYRDFWTIYPPGIFYVLTAVFRVFGASVLASRLFAVGVLSATVCLIYAIITRLRPKITGVMASLAVLLCLKGYMVYNRPGQLAVLFFILCSWAVLKFLKSGSMTWLFVSGVLTGFATLFRQDFGFYFIVSALAIVLLKDLNYLPAHSRAARMRLALKSAAVLSAGLLAVCLPVLTYLVVNSAFMDFIKDAVIFPLTVYPGVRDLPLPEPGMGALIFYFPAFVFLCAAFRFLSHNPEDKTGQVSRLFALFVLLCGIGLFNYTGIRVCISHLLPTLIPAAILFALLFDDFLDFLAARSAFFGKRSSRTAFITVCISLLYFLFKPGFGPYLADRRYLREIRTEGALSGINRLGPVYDQPDLGRSLSGAIKHIQSNTAENEKIFVANPRHDTVVNSDVMFYFLSERHSATGYYELHPGLTDTKEVQSAIINDLIRENVRYIVVWVKPGPSPREPNKSSLSSGVTDLDDFIRSNYKVEKDFGYYAVLRKT